MERGRALERGGYGVEGSLLTTGVVVALFSALRKLIPQRQ